MNGSKFSEAFRHSAVGRYHPDNEKVVSFGSAHKWSDTFSELTHDILQGKDPEPDISLNLLQTYTQWAHVELSSLMNNWTDIENKYDASYVSKLNFHLLNLSSISLWKHMLVDRRTTVTPNLVRAIQNNLAVQAVDFMHLREIDLENGEYISEDHGLRRDAYLGFLNELDTAIITQNISLKSPSTFVIPAASQFESSNHSERNSDLLAIDLNAYSENGERQVRGIQAKLSVEQKTADSIDPEYVTIIDGIVDLGSTKRFRPQKNRSYEVVKPWPGLVAAHHLLNVKNLSVIPNAAKANIRKSANKAITVQAMQIATEAQSRKHEAKKYTAGTKSNNKKAAEIVVDRVLSELYR